MFNNLSLLCDDFLDKDSDDSTFPLLDNSDFEFESINSAGSVSESHSESSSSSIASTSTLKLKSKRLFATLKVIRKKKKDLFFGMKLRQTSKQALVNSYLCEAVSTSIRLTKEKITHLKEVCHNLDSCVGYSEVESIKTKHKEEKEDLEKKLISERLHAIKIQLFKTSKILTKKEKTELENLRRRERTCLRRLEKTLERLV